jgi:hypothetical protein
LALRTDVPTEPHSHRPCWDYTTTKAPGCNTGYTCIWLFDTTCIYVQLYRGDQKSNFSEGKQPCISKPFINFLTWSTCGAYNIWGLKILKWLSNPYIYRLRGIIGSVLVWILGLSKEKYIHGIVVSFVIYGTNRKLDKTMFYVD